MFFLVLYFYSEKEKIDLIDMFLNLNTYILYVVTTFKIYLWQFWNI